MLYTLYYACMYVFYYYLYVCNAGVTGEVICVIIVLTCAYKHVVYQHIYYMYT